MTVNNNKFKVNKLAPFIIAHGHQNATDYINYRKEKQSPKVCSNKNVFKENTLNAETWPLNLCFGDN